ncbi:MAG TPA: YciI family protein [Ignavibacteriaceae bacterium]
MLQYIVYAWDGTDDQAHERRMNARPAHFNCARALKTGDNHVIGGVMLEEGGKRIGSMMVVQFETEEKLKDWLKNEPYITGKV